MSLSGIPVFLGGYYLDFCLTPAAMTVSFTIALQAVRLIMISFTGKDCPGVIDTPKSILSDFFFSCYGGP